MRIYLSTALLASIISLFASSAAPPASAGLLDDILVGPKTLIDRAIEARSSSDMFKDNEIVVKVNAVMADLETIKASTEIYKQRLLITGLFDDTQLYEDFLAGVEAYRRDQRTLLACPVYERGRPGSTQRGNARLDRRPGTRCARRCKAPVLCTTS